jgi:hypothetical protein
MNSLIFALLSQAVAQSPGNGISKSTYSCNDPIPVKEFMYKYFPVKTPGDECSNDICTCSGSGPTWYIQQGRVYIPSNGDQRALLSGRSGGRRLQDPGNGFGLHCVNVSNHLTTGGLSTAEVEAHFNEKLGDMSAYDSFMDFSVSLYTTDLAQYATKFDKDQVPYYTTTWQSSDDEAAQTYTSLIVQAHKSQMILELTSKKSLSVGETSRPVHAAAPSERRLSARALAMIDDLEVKNALTGTSLTTLSVNRAVSAAALAKLDDFYLTGMGTKKVSEDIDAANGYTRKCYLWTGAEVDICFTNRDTSATKGDWKVADYENMLNTVHKNIIVGHPYCQVDKWEDNHYAIDSFSADTSKIISYINKNNVPHVCSSSGDRGLAFPPGMSGLHYIFDPTGWGIQVDLSFSSSPSDCSKVDEMASQSSSRRLQGSNPACQPGICGKSTEILV